jgi:hypothetical protein
MRTLGLILLAATVTGGVAAAVWRQVRVRRAWDVVMSFEGRDLSCLPPTDQERVWTHLRRIMPGIEKPGECFRTVAPWQVRSIHTTGGISRTIVVEAYRGNTNKSCPRFRCTLFDSSLRRVGEAEFLGERSTCAESIRKSRPAELGCEALEIFGDGDRVYTPLYVTAEGDRPVRVLGKEIDEEAIRQRDDERNGKIFSREESLFPHDRRLFPRLESDQAPAIPEKKE